MPGSTPVLGLPYPIPDDTVNVPRDIQALATKIDPLGVVPVGCMMLWPTAAAPTGWLVCDGAQVSATTYPALATLLGQSGGLVTLPNLGGRVPIGADGSHALASVGGEASHVLTPAEAAIANHVHGGTTGIENSSLSHDHYLSGGSSEGAVVTSGAGGTSAGIQQTGTQYALRNLDPSSPPAHSHNFTTGNPANANGAGHNNMQPYLTVNYIMRAG